MDWRAIFWAGFVATTLAVACARLFRSFEWTELTPAGQVGGLFVRDPRLPAAEVVGLLLLFGLGSTLVPALYGTLLQGMDALSWRGGLLVGIVHGALVVGLLPYVARHAASVRHGTLPPPGRFGLRWGRGTPAGILLGHAIYGAVLGAALAAFSIPSALNLPR
ncbi:MAG: hypothetical protein M3P24_08260 [Gemmatimonadota bacterium]|nr:hypothetical protein [Gemmatimonadota bacterium]